MQILITLRVACFLKYFEYLKFAVLIPYVLCWHGFMSLGVSFPALSHMAINITGNFPLWGIWLLSTSYLHCAWHAFGKHLGHVDHDTFTVVPDLAFGCLVWNVIYMEFSLIGCITSETKGKKHNCWTSSNLIQSFGFFNFIIGWSKTIFFITC